MIRSKCFQHYIIFPCELVNVWINYCDKDHLFFFQKSRMILLSVSPSHPAIMVLQKSSIVYMARLNSQSCRIAPWSDELIYGKSTDEQ